MSKKLTEKQKHVLGVQFKELFRAIEYAQTRPIEPTIDNLR